MPLTDANLVPQAFFPSFEVLRPAEQTAAFVFSSPHSGRIYPPEFLAISRLDPQTLRKSEDWFVDQLFSGVATLGAPLLSRDSRAPILTSTANLTNSIPNWSTRPCRNTPIRNRFGSLAV